jgi:thioredoxin reductase (NADPH)
MRVAASVTILTNGSEAEAVFPPEVQVVTTPIMAIVGDKRLEEVHFNDGKIMALSGLFIAMGVAGVTELAKSIGAVTETGRIVTDQTMRTSVPGLWAAGDCAGGMKQIAKAVHEGAVAGTEAVKYIRKVRDAEK